MIDEPVRSRPDPARVNTLGELAQELGLLRSRAAHGTRSGKVSLDDLARRVNEPRSTIHAYITGKRLPPSEVLDRIVISLFADASEQRQWAEAWYRVSASRDLEHRAEHRPVEHRLAGPADAGSDDRVNPDGARPIAASQAKVPRQLPLDIHAFTGRTGELAALDAVLGTAASRTRIAVVSGTAGVGKTALAVHWSEANSEQFPDGCLYVDLRGYGPGPAVEPAQALTGFLHALGDTGLDVPHEPAERAAHFRSLLAHRRMLILLDNARDTEHLRLLLPGSSPSAVLATSRDSLSGLVARHGARRIELDLLPMTDAVALLDNLIDRGSSTDPAVLATVAAQCARLPLALRIAAEFLDGRPSAQLPDLAAELADSARPLDLFDSGGDPFTALRTVFSWSYRHLAVTSARAFRLLGRHPGSDFEAYTLAALADTSLPEARRDLDALLRAHLIQQTGPGVYGMHLLLRGYAAELATAEPTAVSETGPSMDSAPYRATLLP